MKRLCLLLLCFLSFIVPVQALLSETITIKWLPDATNTLQADAFLVTRQLNATGPWEPVCTADATSKTCMDTTVPSGNTCWKAQARSGTILGPESAQVCRTTAQFTGTLTIIMSP